MKRRMLALMLCLSMMLCALPLGAGAEETVSWALEGGTLSVTGSGEMRFRTIPWADRLGEIQKLTLDEGITGIQADAFSGCTALRSVTLPRICDTLGIGPFPAARSCAGSHCPNPLWALGRRPLRAAPS